MLLIALAVGFYMAWNIGANDVANAFGTAVGSGAVNFRLALILAAIFEFSGAFFVGSSVADTIKGNIVLPSAFEATPHLFALGMLAALLAASIWLHVATFMGKPVSTTHAIIGAVIGFGLVAKGAGAVQWVKLIRIAASWFVSPLVGGGLAFLVYYAIRRTVLRNDDPVRRAKMVVPLGLGSTIGIVLLSIVYQMGPRFVSGCSAKQLCLMSSPGVVALAVAAGLIARGIIALRTRDRVHVPHEAYTTVERWFGRLQIVTACYMSFAHGANDVANAIGPVAAVLQAARGCVTAKALVPSWGLAFGGLGIVAGLAMYGYKVIEAVGKKITEVTPTRGFSAEFGTATTVLVCSMMGLPISTTFVLVGAVMGVGFARGFGAIDMSVVKSIFASWVITIPISAVLAAVIYKALLVVGL